MTHWFDHHHRGGSRSRLFDRRASSGARVADRRGCPSCV